MTEPEVTEGVTIPASTYIVGIGASAGGLNALEHFFDVMPTDSGMAFVIIQHLSPDFKSLMDDLLSRHTSMNIPMYHCNYYFAAVKYGSKKSG